MTAFLGKSVTGDHPVSGIIIMPVIMIMDKTAEKAE
jgi:hypothetical protein